MVRRTGSTDRSSGLVIGVALVACGMLLLAALEYMAPLSSRYPGPINLSGMWRYESWLGQPPLSLSIKQYQWLFRALVAEVWLGYFVLVYSGLRNGVDRTKGLLSVAALTALMLAIVFPPLLTHDLYAYMAYGRMAPVYGLNPYTSSLEELARLGDMFATHYPTAAPTVYGPLWTLVTSGLAFALQGLAVPTQLMSLKLLQAAALMGAAIAARRIARDWDPGRADLTLLAVAMNPLLLLEGPCNGHNDVLMIALMLVGVALVLGKRWVAGFLVLGLSASVKYVSAAIVPWLIIEQIRAMDPAAAIKRAIAAALLVLGPIVLLFAPFWVGAGTFSAIGSVYQKKAPGGQPDILGIALVLILYAVATVWVWRSKDGALAPAWTLWSAATAVWGMPGPVLPWYLTWPSALTFARWDRRQVLVSAAVSVLGFWVMLYYSNLR